MCLVSTCSGAAGSSTTNLAPPSSESSSQIFPPTSVTTRWQIARPRPVPSSGPLVVKKGSKMRPRISRGIPGPESPTVTRTQPARAGVRLPVAASGPGSPREIRGRIFDPFFTTKGPDEGTGLGLAICQRVVTEVGGKIWIEDSELGGARFVVELPAAPENVETRHIG